MSSSTASRSRSPIGSGELFATISGSRCDRDWDEVSDSTRGIEWTTWFTGARLNVATACVHRWADERPDEEAAVWQSEDGARAAFSWSELSQEVTRFAEALVALGVGAGDTVAMYLPMSPQAAIVSHACAHIGAIQVPIFSGFAAPAIAARLDDAAREGARHRGRDAPAGLGRSR